jgi:hypothetical protein
MTISAGVAGDQELVARLARAHDGLLDLTDANRDLVKIVEREASADVPRSSGALAASETVTVSGDGWGIAYSKPYAVPVHWGTRYLRARPWLMTAARSTEDRWMDQLTEHVQQLLD